MHQQLVLVAYDISSPRRSRLVRQSLRAHDKQTKCDCLLVPCPVWSIRTDDHNH
jgi:hypothetical protein